MMIKEINLKYVLSIFIIFGTHVVFAEPWQLKVIVKRPYLTEHYDSLGNVILDPALFILNF